MIIPEEIIEQRGVMCNHSLFISSTYTYTYYTITVFTYLLTYSMVQSPSWEANWFAASQEIPRILWNPKDYYCVTGINTEMNSWY